MANQPPDEAAKRRIAEIDARHAKTKAMQQENLVKAREVRAANLATKRGLSAPPQIIERPAEAPGLELKRASEIPDKPITAIGVPSKAAPAEQGETAIGVPSKRDPRRVVQEAQERLQRRSLTMVRRLEEMTELALNDGPKCPTCQRGLPRAEDIRLRATIAVLDRAGLAPQRGQEALSAAGGPVLVFPPGTRIAIDSGDPRPEPIDLGTARRVDPGPVLRRGDEA